MVLHTERFNGSLSYFCFLIMESFQALLSFIDDYFLPDIRNITFARVADKRISLLQDLWHLQGGKVKAQQILIPCFFLSSLDLAAQ